MGDDDDVDDDEEKGTGQGTLSESSAKKATRLKYHRRNTERITNHDQILADLSRPARECHGVTVSQDRMGHGSAEELG